MGGCYPPLSLTPGNPSKILPTVLSPSFPSVLPVLSSSRSVAAFREYNPHRSFLEKQGLLVRLLTRTQRRERLPRACRKLQPLTTQSPSAPQHQGTLSRKPILPQLMCLQPFRGKKGAENRKRKKKKKKRQSFVLYKRFVSLGSLPPPLKTMS